MIYFASDFHLGAPTLAESKLREKKIVAWMDEIFPTADALYLVGDIFDFWFEYGSVIPRGYSLFLGKLSEWRAAEKPVYFFTGNHDMWMFDYFEKEYGIPVYRHPIELQLGELNVYIGHGDGLGPGDHKYKFLKKIFSNSVCQWLFARLHPNFGIGLASYWSRSSRLSQTDPKSYLGDDREWLTIFCNEQLDRRDYDYFIFGHRHLPLEVTLKNGKSRYINLGDWITHFTYAVFDGQKISLLTYPHE